MKLSILLSLVLVALFTGQAQGQTSDPIGQTLSPGDQLRIVVYRDTDLTCDCVVAFNGTIVHPLYREVPVVGVPMSVVEERLRIFLSKYKQNAQFVVQALVKIVVRGEVKSPNIYSVPPETTLAQAVQLAGGATDNGKLDKIVVIRERQEIKVDLSRPDSEAAMLQIRSNDQIVIGRKRQPILQYIAPVASSAGLVLAIVNLATRASR